MSRINQQFEKAFLSHILQSLNQKGYRPVRVECGGDDTWVNSCKQALHQASQFDECYIFFKHANWLHFIFGNGESCISNWTIGEAAFDKTMDKVTKDLDTFTLKFIPAKT